MTVIIWACNGGSFAKPVSISFDALSKISRAVMVLPRASLGSETLNILVMKSVTRLDAEASRLARTLSRMLTIDATISTNAEARAVARAARWRRANLRARYASEGGTASTGSLFK